MRVEEAYKLLTEEAKRLALRSCAALIEAQTQQKRSDQYIRQILLGLRTHPVGEDVCRCISGYFTGNVGIAVSPEEVQTRVSHGTATAGAAG